MNPRADSSVDEVYGDAMGLASMKCHSVRVELCIVLGRDRDNTSTPPPPAPSSFPSPVVNEKFLRRGRPFIVAV